MRQAMLLGLGLSHSGDSSHPTSFVCEHTIMEKTIITAAVLGSRPTKEMNPAVSKNLECHYFLARYLISGYSYFNYDQMTLFEGRSS